MLFKNVLGIGAVAAVIAIGGAIMLTNHYEMGQDLGMGMFWRLNRWTGTREMCGTIGSKTYCGADLRPALDAWGEAEYQECLRQPHGDGCYQAILQHGRKPGERERPSEGYSRRGVDQAATALMHGPGAR